MAHILAYRDYRPSLGAGVRLAGDAALIGRVRLGDGVALGPLAVLRADGEHIAVGEDSRFLDRATVHISDGLLGSVIGRRVTVGRYALVHACTLGDDCVLADGAVVMDGAELGPGAVVAAGALVPPGKSLAGGTLYAGSPARPVAEISAAETAALRDAVLAGRDDGEHLACDLPALDMGAYAPGAEGLAGGAPEIDKAAYVAPGSVIAGPVSVGAGSGIWFATVCHAAGPGIRIGRETSVQDNAILLTRPGSGPIVVGDGVTIGHNVRMGACAVGDDCLIGMGCEIGDGVVVEDGAVVGARALVEPGTVVKAGWIWAGRPARAFRPVAEKERLFFARGREVYVGYAAAYLTQAVA